MSRAPAKLPRWSPGLAAAVLAAVAATAAGPGADALPGAQEKPRQETPTCVTASCHAGVGRARVPHRPAAAGACRECHEPAVVEQHLFRFSVPKRELCTRCHQVESGSTVHAPVASGDCTACHDPHGSEHQALLVADLAGGLCRRCHEAAAFDKAFVHGPVAIGACTVCHEPHAASHDSLLAKDAKTLCIDCHQESAPRGIAARHEHRPMRDGCTTCHDPHASDVRFQLRSQSPDLCYTCHAGIAKIAASAPVVHEIVNQAEGCVQCHDPHFTQLPYLQRRSQPDLCLSCHDREIATPDGATLTDMSRLLSENPDHHGPIREGGCTTCHQPHGAEHFRLLHQAYPPEFYAPFEPPRYALCFSCHLPDMVTDPSGTGLTGFRDGDRNLHWLHVNQEKGRTCRACHEVHASRRPFHIRDTVPFGAGGWLLEINFERGEDGGSCAPACHKTKTYRRGKPAAEGSSGAP